MTMHAKSEQPHNDELGAQVFQFPQRDAAQEVDAHADYLRREISRLEQKIATRRRKRKADLATLERTLKELSERVNRQIVEVTEQAKVDIDSDSRMLRSHKAALENLKES